MAPSVHAFCYSAGVDNLGPRVNKRATRPAAWPDYHRQGIGKLLVNEGLSLLKETGGQGCALVGDPNFYKRFGFRNFPELVHKGVPQEVFLALPFTAKVPQGIVVFHKGFLAKS